MPYANPQPKPVDIGEILKHFFEHSPIDWSKGYELLGEVSDEELEFLDHVFKNTDLGGEQPTEGVFLAELRSKRSDRKVLLKVARYDDQHHPMIAMAVFGLKPHETQEEAIESFALFADEYGEGFAPIQFQTHTVQ